MAAASTESKIEKSKLFHSIWVNYFPADPHNNAITGRDRDQWELKFGSEYAIEKMHTDYLQKREEETQALPLGARHHAKLNIPMLYFSPFVFRQANIDKFEEIIAEIRNQLKNFQSKFPDQFEWNLLELYGGVGTIGLNCLDLVKKLLCSDENPNNVFAFQKSLEHFNAEWKARAVYRSLGAAQSVKNGEVFSHNLIVIDPPRKGMDEDTIRALLSSPSSQAKLLEQQKLQQQKSDEGAAAAAPAAKKTKVAFDEEGNIIDPSTLAASSTASANTSSSHESMKGKRLVYISCGFEAFKRDCDILTGKKTIESSNFPSSGNEENDSSREHGHFSSKKRKYTDATAANPDLYKSYWKLVYAKGFVLFPGSDHIETLAVFDREDYGSD